LQKISAALGPCKSKKSIKRSKRASERPLGTLCGKKSHNTPKKSLPGRHRERTLRGIPEGTQKDARPKRGKKNHQRISPRAPTTAGGGREANVNTARIPHLRNYKKLTQPHESRIQKKERFRLDLGEEEKDTTPFSEWKAYQGQRGSQKTTGRGKGKNFAAQYDMGERRGQQKRSRIIAKSAKGEQKISSNTGKPRKGRVTQGAQKREMPIGKKQNGH